MPARSKLLAAVFTTAALAAATATASQPASAATIPADTGGERVTSTQDVAATSALTRSVVGLVDGLPALAGATLTAKDALRDSTGATHVRLDRSFKGLPVLGGDVVVHRSAKGGLLGVTGGLTKAVSISTEPTITAKQASKGLKHVSGRPSLVIDAISGTPRLAWKVTTGGHQHNGTPSRLDRFVDARTGKTLRTEENILNVDGQGQTLYLGTVPLDLTQSGSTYQLKSGSRGGTYTTDAGNKTDSALCGLLGNCPTGTLVTSPTTTFGNGSNTNRATAAADAQRGSDLTWDYFKNNFGRNGIFGTGKGSFNRVHYGQNYVNAFWDGTKMTYGDGDGTNYGPLVSLDVAGHEMTHGVTENSANLTYSGESGGLNEATSDIFGTMVEFSAADAKDPGDYLIGEQFDLKKKAGLRRMDNPSADGQSLNCYSANAKNVDVHYSSGIGNHFFYLLAEGSGAKSINGVAHSSTTCDGSTVSGIGRDAAAKIWYRALTVYFTSSTTYAGARTGSLSAAKDLYGAGSTQYNAVAAAWKAVSVN